MNTNPFQNPKLVEEAHNFPPSVRALERGVKAALKLLEKASPKVRSSSLNAELSNFEIPHALFLGGTSWEENL